MKRQIARIGTFYAKGQFCGKSQVSVSHVSSLQQKGANRNYSGWLPCSRIDKKIPVTGNYYHGQRRPFTTPSSSSSSSAQKRAQRGAWASLSPTEQVAWQVLHYTQDSWEGRQPPPPWKEWSDLTLDERAAAQYGLNVHTKDEWNAMAPSKSKGIPSLQSLLDGSYDSDDDNRNRNNNKTNNKSLMIAQETRALRKQQQSSSKAASVANMAFNTVKGLAPIVGPMIRSAAQHAKGHKGLGLALAGTLLESIPAVMDATSGVLDVTGIDTVIYLDDSGSMTGSNLYQGQSALQSLERRLKTHNNNDDDDDDNHDDDDDDDDQRFLPTRIVKFGNHPTIMSPSDEDWSLSLVNAAWDGSSGGTYMWKMIQGDIEAKYRPAGGKLRVVVITDGADNLSPGPYYGTRGFDPLMNHLLRQGFDIEWHIIVVGNYGLFGSELSERDKTLYQSLCRATGGQFLSVESHGWDEDNPQVATFLEAIEDSGYDDSKEQRRKRQEQYKLEARKGKAENFDWLPALPTNDDDDNDNNKK